MEIYIIRHGKTYWNDKHLAQGSADIELNEDGIALAQKTGKGLMDVDFDVIYASPLKRAYKTAELIRNGRDIPIIKDDRLKEISFGDKEGSYYSVKECNDEYFNTFFNDPANFEPNTGETIENLIKRTKNFLKEVIEPCIKDRKRVMIVGHGAMNKALMCTIMNHGKEQFWSGGLQHNLAFTIVELDENGYRLVEQNKTFFEK